jgi:hypothetical protein
MSHDEWKPSSTNRELTPMPIKQAVGAVTGVLLLLTAAPVMAHHAFSAEFDAKRPVTLRGTVVKVEWINPHSWFHVDVKQPDGKVQRWMVEAGNPNNLFRRGWSRDVISPGMEIIIDGYQAKDASRRANGRDLTFADGRKLFMGSSGTGAPRDGRDPTERK